MAARKGGRPFNDAIGEIDRILAECGVKPGPPLLSLQFGAASMQSQVDPGKAITACNVSSSLQLQLAPFMAMLKPFLCLINVVTGLFDIFTGIRGIQDVLDIPDKLEDLRDDLACVLKITPQLAVPQMIIDAMIMVMAQLVCIRNQIRALEQAMEDVEEMRRLMVENPEQAAKLLVLAECKQQNTRAVLMGIAGALEALKIIMTGIQELAGMVGLEVFSDDILNAVDRAVPDMLGDDDLEPGLLGDLAEGINDILYPMLEGIGEIKEFVDELLQGLVPVPLPNLAWVCDPKGVERQPDGSFIPRECPNV